MNIFKPRTVNYWQVASIKWATLAAGLLIAHYWPVVTTWVAFWWVVFVATTLYVLSFWLKK